MKTTREVVQLMIEEGIARPTTIKGCSPDEIAMLEKKAGYLLPAQYKAFLSVMGHQAGELDKGSDFLYEEVLTLTEDAKTILEEDDLSDFKLPSNAFVIFMHQGYIFSYFLLGEDDDPAVFSYSIMESEGKPRKTASSFTDYLYNSVQEYIRVKKLIEEARTRRSK